MKNKIRKFSVLVVLGILIASGITMLPTSAQLTITITDLGTLGADWSFAYAINDFGQVVGESDTTSGETHAFLWSETTGMIDLGTLGGFWSVAYDINTFGQVVGESRTGGTQDVICAFLITPEDTNNDGIPDLWYHDNDFDGANDLMINLGALADGYELSQFYSTRSIAFAINDLGEVVGKSISRDEEYHAFIWSPDIPDDPPYNPKMRDLGTLGGSVSQANDINDLGQVVGESKTSTSQTHAFLWTETSGMQQILFPTGENEYSRAEDINNLGVVVGTTNINSGTMPAFLWTETGGMIDIGTLGGSVAQAKGINDLDQVVGISNFETSINAHAFMWEENEMKDLGALTEDTHGKPPSKPPCVSWAEDINMNGQVAGSSITDPVGDVHAVVFTIEEPSQVARDRIRKMKKKVQAKVDAGEMSRGHANSLKKKLDAAEKLLPEESSSTQSTEFTSLAEQMSDKDVKATINVLNAFINQVNAFINAGILTQVEGQEWIDDANLIISDLGG